MALSQIERQFGKGAVVKMGEETHMAVEGISTPYAVDVRFTTVDTSFRVEDCLRSRLCLRVIDTSGGQRLFDNVFLLLALGLAVMFILYTGWGLWEITSLPEGRLP